MRLVLADVNATDPDDQGGGGNDATNDFENLKYSITGGNGAGLFEIDADTGQISLASGQQLDYESDNQHVLTVKVQDQNGTGLSDTVDVTINVTDVNEAPNAGTDFSASAAENVGDAVVLADVNATDPDDQGGGGNDATNDFENLKYSITGGNGAGLFEIDADTGQISLASGQQLDYESDNQHVLTVKVQDQNGTGLSDTVDVTINVTDVPENNAPLAVDDKWFVSDATTAALSAATALLGNDSDPDLDALKVTALSNDGTTWFTDASDGLTDNVVNLNTAQGTLAVNTVTGAITYTTDNQTAGDVTDTFYYRIADVDPSPLTDEGKVTVIVKDIGSGPATDTVNLSAETYQVSYISSGNGGDTVTGGGGLDTFLGGAADDILVGGNGNDVIFGDAGVDKITGSGGDDTIDSGSGNDTIAYTSVLDGNDVINGFDENPGGGQDVIDLDALFDTYGGVAVVGTRASHVDISQSGSDTLVRIDTNNSVGSYEMVIKLTSMTATNITLGTDVLLGS
jgi:hypothetical protein